MSRPDTILPIECPDCAGHLSLDHGSPDEWENPGTPRMVYCPVCGTDFPQILGALDGAEQERVRLREKVGALDAENVMIDTFFDSKDRDTWACGWKANIRAVLALLEDEP